MKKIIITGKNSFIGASFESFIKKKDSRYEVTSLDLKNVNWNKIDFSNTDVIFHVAGIAHSDISKANKEMIQQYYQVNCNLAVKTAKKAKKDGVNQFIFMSSMIVYGESAGIGSHKMIDKDSIPKPSNFYGDSKWKAEQKLKELADDNFKIVILRPPMIYGKGSKGNFQILLKIAKRTPIFPDIKNQRSMISIRNFCYFVWNIIENQEEGIFFPQDKEYVETRELIRKIADKYKKKIWFTKLCNPIVYLLALVPNKKINNMVNKAFGNFTYDKNLRKIEL